MFRTSMRLSADVKMSPSVPGNAVPRMSTCAPGPHSRSRSRGRSGGNWGEWQARSVSLITHADVFRVTAWEIQPAAMVVFLNFTTVCFPK